MSRPVPTDFELEILQELWARGPQTVRQVHESLIQRRAMVYTSVLKAMQLMHEKGLVRRDDSQRAHIYEAAVAEEATKNGIVGNLMDQVFGGSAAELAMHALASRPASSEEIRMIQDLLEELESRQQDHPADPRKQREPDR